MHEQRRIYCSVSRQRLIFKLQICCTAALLQAVMSANTQADCPVPTYDPASGKYEISIAPGTQSAIAANGEGKFVVVWQALPVTSPGAETHTELNAVRLDTTLSCLGDPISLIAPRPQPPYNSDYGCEKALNPSLSMNLAGDGFLAFTQGDARCLAGCIQGSGLQLLRQIPFSFEPFNPGTSVPPTSPSFQCPGPWEFEPSAAIDAAGCASTAWSRIGGSLAGLDLQSCADVPKNVIPCGGASQCFTGRWQPCAASANGYVALAWADPENTGDPGTAMNIKLRVFSSSGVPVTEETLVNNPSLEIADSSQESPAVAFDSTGRLVVAWTGPALADCTTALYSRYVFARRFGWTQGSNPHPMEDEFVVQGDDSINSSPGRPTVAFSQKPGQEGRFVIVWNATHPGVSYDQVYARLFDWRSFAMGKQFLVNIVDDNEFRYLGNSAQHTAVWTSLGTIAATWTHYTTDVNVTLLPDGYAESLCYNDSCCRGDLNHDGYVNGLDIQNWTGYVYFRPAQPAGPCRIAGPVPCELDMNGDCRFVPNGPGNDWEAFTCRIWNPYCTCPGNPAPSTCCDGTHFADGQGSGVSESAPSPFRDDCNQNGATDIADIASGYSVDCNQNLIPDECDVGFDPRITDVNHNLIPDDCEPGIGAAAAAQSSALGDPSAMLAIMNQWWNSFDYEGLKAWQIAYEIKMKFAELGFDLRATLEDGGAQP